MLSSRARPRFPASGPALAHSARRLALIGLLALAAVAGSASDAAGRAHYETRYIDWSPLFGADRCGDSDTVVQRIHVHGKAFRLFDVGAGDRVADGTWFPPSPDPSTDYNDSDDMVSVEGARLSGDRHGRYVRVTVRGLTE